MEKEIREKKTFCYNFLDSKFLKDFLNLIFQMRRDKIAISNL